MEENEVEQYDPTSEICELVRGSEDNYVNGETKTSKYVSFNQYENIEKINAYLNSKHISGDTDAEGREKPFFNIVTAAVNIWYRATDIDRKDITIVADKRQYWLMAFIATIHLQEWMKRARFGAFLNDWGRTLAQFGSAILKFVEKDGILIPTVVPWTGAIVDVINFDDNAKIEKYYNNAAQLRNNKSFNQKAVEQLISEAETIRKNLSGEEQDNIDDYYEIYEVHGKFPLSWHTKDPKDADKYVEQMYTISFQLDSDNETYLDYVLAGGLADEQYMITHLIEEKGRTQSIGAVEYLFDAQWMQNHTAKLIKDQLDLASLQIFQTADGGFLGMNVLSAMQNGDILVHTPNNELTQVNNSSHDIASLQAYGRMFYENGQRIVSATDAIAGNNMPANTPYSSLELMNTESHGLFEIMTENKGFHIEDMMRKFVLPYIKKKMDTNEELAATLSSVNLEKFDSIYVPAQAIRNANKKVAEQMFNDQVAAIPDLAGEENDVRNELKQLGAQRFLKPSDIDTKTWNDFFDDFIWNAEVVVTSEQKDKQTILTTLSTALKAIVADPTLLTDPTKKFIFGKILENTGAISAVELSNLPTPRIDPRASGESPKSVGDLATIKTQ